jgi:hypothetical protein
VRQACGGAAAGAVVAAACWKSATTGCGGWAAAAGIWRQGFGGRALAAGFWRQGFGDRAVAIGVGGGLWRRALVAGLRRGFGLNVTGRLRYKVAAGCRWLDAAAFGGLRQAAAGRSRLWPGFGGGLWWAVMWLSSEKHRQRAMTGLAAAVCGGIFEKPSL